MIIKSRFLHQQKVKDFLEKNNSEEIHEIFWSPNPIDILNSVRHAYKKSITNIITDILPHELPISTSKYEYDFFVSHHKYFPPEITQGKRKESTGKVIVYDEYSINKNIPEYLNILKDQNGISILKLQNNHEDIEKLFQKVINSDSVLLYSRCPQVILLVNHISKELSIPCIMVNKNIKMGVNFWLCNTFSSPAVETFTSIQSIREIIKKFVSKAECTNNDDSKTVIKPIVFNEQKANEIYSSYVANLFLKPTTKYDTFEDKHLCTYFLNAKKDESIEYEKFFNYFLKYFIQHDLNSQSWKLIYNKIKEIGNLENTLLIIINEIYELKSCTNELFVKLGISHFLYNKDREEKDNIDHYLNDSISICNYDIAKQRLSKNNSLKIAYHFLQESSQGKDLNFDKLIPEGTKSTDLIKSLPSVFEIIGEEKTVQLIEYIYSKNRYKAIKGLYEQIVLSILYKNNISIKEIIFQTKKYSKLGASLLKYVDLETRKTKTSQTLQVLYQNNRLSDWQGHDESFKIFSVKLLAYQSDKRNLIVELLNSLNLSKINSVDFFDVLNTCVCLNLENEILLFISLSEKINFSFNDSKESTLFLYLYNVFIEELDIDFALFRMQHYNYISNYETFITHPPDLSECVKLNLIEFYKIHWQNN